MPQGQPQGPPTGYWTSNPPQQRAPFVLSPLNWFAVVLLPIGLLIGIIIQATGAYTAPANVFALLGNAAVAVGGLALVGGLIVASLKKGTDR